MLGGEDIQYLRERWCDLQNQGSVFVNGEEGMLRKMLSGIIYGMCSSVGCGK